MGKVAQKVMPTISALVIFPLSVTKKLTKTKKSLEGRAAKTMFRTPICSGPERRKASGTRKNDKFFGGLKIFEKIVDETGKN